jgi:hypothetical protein
MLKNKLVSQYLEPAQFKDFIELFQNLIMNENYEGKKDILDFISICFRNLISEYSEDIHNEEKMILNFFKEFFTQSSSKTHEKLYFNILCSLNHFIYFRGFNLAKEIRELGEILIENMCSVWREKTNDNLRVNLKILTQD